ncbi:MAG: carbon monoxide dehydrogenase subunit G [Caldilineaceae bacterium]|mgnify:CR=1 FL=1|jgi:carbon monoxide dehydrogenase subunit G|nr:carbon monoxide dehydrogenase subunit G [Caldilineaceae bacterium]
MRLEGTHTFAAPRSEVWAALMNPTVLASALPGGEQLEQVGEHDYRAAMNVKVGPVQGRFEGKITLTDITPLQQYTMKVDGQGAPGFVAGEGTLLLEDQENGGTLLRYGGEVQVGGRIAGVGQRLIESTARSLTRQGLAALDAALAPAVEAGRQGEGETGRQGEASAQSPNLQSPISPSPSMTGIVLEVARDVAKDLAAEYIPADKQERVLWFGLGALAMLAFVVLVRLVQRD